MRGTRTLQKGRSQYSFLSYSALCNVPSRAEEHVPQGSKSPLLHSPNSCLGHPASGLTAVWWFWPLGFGDTPSSHCLSKLPINPWAVPCPWWLCQLSPHVYNEYSLSLYPFCWNTLNNLFSWLDTDEHNLGDEVLSYLHVGWMIKKNSSIQGLFLSFFIAGSDRSPIVVTFWGNMHCVMFPFLGI